LGVSKAKRITQQRWRGQAESDAAGNYGICGVPTDVGLRILAATDSAVSGLIDLPPADSRVQRRDFLIGATGDTGPTAFGAVNGTVTDSSGRPIADARIIADGATERRSGSDGRFIVHSVPVGTRQVEILAIGMSPVVNVVDVTIGDTASVVASMHRITTLDVVRVTASPRARRLIRDMEERRKSGTGYVRDSTDIRNIGCMFSMFFEFPNSVVQRTGAGSAFVITLPGTGAARCVANVVVDGRRSDYDELLFLRPVDIAAVEFYPRRMSLPMAFVRPDNDCGAVVVWTKWAFGRPGYFSGAGCGAACSRSARSRYERASTWSGLMASTR
jgi:hypothetical protein